MTEVTTDVKQDEPTQAVDKTPDTIPYSRFKEVNDSFKEVQTELEKMKEAQEKQRKAELEKQGEYKTLLEEQNQKLEELSTYKTKWETYEQDRRKALIDKIPADKREKYENKPLDVLEDVAELFKPDSKVSVSSSPPDKRKRDYSEWIDLVHAHRAGKITDKEYVEQRKRFTKKS